jgi:hypothetical protein
VFVTNSIGFLPQVHQIIVIENSSIVEIGSYDFLIKQNGAFSIFFNKHNEIAAGDDQQMTIENQIDEMQISKKNQEVEFTESLKYQQTSDETKRGEKIIEKEKIEEGNVRVCVCVKEFSLKLLNLKLFLNIISGLFCLKG